MGETLKSRAVPLEYGLEIVDHARGWSVGRIGTPRPWGGRLRLPAHRHHSAISACAAFTSERICRSSACTTADRCPCFTALLFPGWAPLPFPRPCLRPRFFPFPAGAWHALPFRVVAKQ